MTSLEEKKETVMLITEAVQNGARKEKACKAINLPLRTLQRWGKNSAEDRRSLVKKYSMNKLSTKERDNVIKVCCSDRFKDMSPNEIVPILAEEGIYIASESTYYRILRQEDLLTHRSESKPGLKKNKPNELKATGPNQVWCWDITYILSAVKGKYYYLYMFEDVWSRAIVGWDVYESENSEHASELMKRISREKNVNGVTLHSDNGSPMKGATMLATLQGLGVVPSFSRPSVSNDNPYSESLFKTLKYSAGYPRVFNSTEDAREWIYNFVNWYNNEHRHSGIKFVTPMQRYNGIDKELLEKRKRTYEKARKSNPERWSKKIRNWDWIEDIYLNPENTQDSQLKVA